MTREKIKKLINSVIKNLYSRRIEVKLEHSAEPTFGDYSTNIAMILKKNPQEIANAIKSPILEKIEVKNEFINFFLSKEYLQKRIGEILRKNEKFGQLKIGKNQKVNIEFISANPTGPLTLANGRGGFYGDVLANILEKAGYKVEREYYINNMGEQVKKLGHSILGDSEAVYKGAYIERLRKIIKGDNPEKVGKTAAKIILKEYIKPSVKKMGIKFDNWFSEESLYKNGEVDNVIKELKKKNLTYEKDGALWFKSTKFGDDKDRVLIKEDGEKTYFTSDIAYLKNKFKRGFKKLIYILGADHYGYINRLKAAAEALGYKKEQLVIIIMQLVRLFKEGKELKMGKRTGMYITIDELIDEVGLDVARFFFLSRSPEIHLNFDLNLAKEQSEKNPVYYIQYAYARICSILRKCKMQNVKIKMKIQNAKLLNHPSELSLIKQLIRFPEIINDIIKDYHVQRVPQYALDLAVSFHQFYRDCKVLTDKKSLREARLGLIFATKIVLKNTFDLLSISAPEKM